MADASDVLGKLWLGEIGVDPELAKTFSKSEFLHLLTVSHDTALLVM